MKSPAQTSTTKFITSTHFMDKKFNLLNYWPMFHTCLTDRKKNSLKTIEERSKRVRVLMDYT